MALQDWNWRLPVELQDVPWDCAAASVTWCLNTIGNALTEYEVVHSMYPDYLSPAYGLLDASGAGLVEWLATQGVAAANNTSASWQEVVDAAGHQPMLIGGRSWCHWTGVRVYAPMVVPGAPAYLALANPAPGWGGVGQVMDSVDFHNLGTFSAVWFTSW